MKLFSIITALILSFQIQTFAQTATWQTSKSNQLSSTYIDEKVQVDALRSLVTTAYLLKSYMPTPQPCFAEAILIGFLNSTPKAALYPVIQEDSIYADDLWNLSQSAQNIAQSIMSSSCFKPNDQCCKKSGNADESDTCVGKKSANCTLYGIKIKSCGATSNDCN